MSENMINFSQFYTESINDKNLFKSVFMVGAPGSGKSFISGKLFGGLGVVTLNSDDIFEMALFNNYITGNPNHMADTHKVLNLMRNVKSGNMEKIFTADYMNSPEIQTYREDRVKPLTAKRMAFWINGMLPIIVDGTGKNPHRLNKQKDFLEKIGYDVSGVYINIDLQTSLDRNEKRYRSVDIEMLKKTWEQINALGSAGTYKKIFGKNFKEVDATIDMGDNNNPQTIIELKQLRKAGGSFIAASLKNPVGKDILKTLKVVKGKYYIDAFPDSMTIRNLELQWSKVAWSTAKK